jgi:hypothetical protein
MTKIAHGVVALRVAEATRKRERFLAAVLAIRGPAGPDQQRAGAL